MKRILTIAAFLTLMMFGVSASSFAQTGIVYIDRVEGLISGDTVLAGVPISFIIGFNNNTANKVDVSNGFRITMPDGTGDFDSVTIDSIGPIVGGEATWFLPLFNVVYSFSEEGVDNDAPDTVGFLGAGNPTQGTRQYPAGRDDSVFAVTVWFDAADAANTHGDRLCIDSSFFGVGGTWVWTAFVGGGVVNFTPEWQGLTPGQTHTTDGYCFTIFDPAQDVTENNDGTLPKEFAVSQNFPNPFNPTTKINFEVPQKSMVNLAVYNVLGQKVATLVDQEMTAGKYVADWDGTSDQGAAVASGIYFYKFEAGNFVQTKKMVLMK